MKIGIVTIIDQNYGNRLQNYAAQEVLKKYGEVETIPFVKRDKNVAFRWLVKKVLRKFKKNCSYAWEEFDLKINFGPYQVDKDRDKLIERYDFVSLGSDQVWNTEWYESNPMRKDTFLLSYFKKKQKVCFSPSFGISEIGEEWKDWFTKNLNDMPYLSVREEAGAKIIKKLTGRTAEVLIDPTLMLDSTEWKRLERKPKYIECDEKYIFTYLLGELTSEMQQKTKDIANEYNCQVINMHELIYDKSKNIGPSEFLYLINHAFIVLTDSFHASVFSFLFEKPFLLFARAGANNGMLSRMDTLMHTFGLERKYVNSGIDNDLLECDYFYGFKQLEKEREKVNKFLDKAFQQK